MQRLKLCAFLLSAIFLTACLEQPTEDTESSGGASPFPVPVVSTTFPTGPSAVWNISVIGTAAPNALIGIFTTSSCSGAPLATGTADGAGDWTISYSVNTNATTKFYARASDGVGLVSHCSSTHASYTNDIQPPATPTFTSLTPEGPSSVNNPLMRGKGTIGSTVTIYSDAACTSFLASGTVNTGGNFLINVTVPDDSSTVFYADSNDAVGNYSNCAGPFLTYQEDSTAPATPTVASILPTGPANNNAPVVSGTAPPNTGVKLYTDAACATASIGSGFSDGSGNFSIPATVLNNSSQSIYAAAFDLAANASGCSATSVTYVEDSTPPAKPVLTGTSPVSPANNNNLTLNGTGEAGTALTIYSNSACTTIVTTLTIDGTGTFAIPLTVSDNTTNNYYAKVRDSANNASACSAVRTYVEDSLAPTVPNLTTTSPASPSNVNTPTVQGTTSASAIVTLYSDSGCTTSVGTGTANSSGAFGISITVADDSTNNIYAKAVDLAGNASACSSTPKLYMEDSNPPSVPAISGTVPLGPANDNNPEIEGLGDPNVLVYLYSNSSCTTSLGSGLADGSGAFSITINVADYSTTNIYARARETSGNYSACSAAPVVYIEDSTPLLAPVLVSASPTSPSSNNNPDITGTAPASADITLYSDAGCTTAIGAGTSDSNGDFTISISVTSNTTTTIRAKTTLGGVNSSCSSSTLVYVEDSAAPSIPVISASNPVSPSNVNVPMINGTSEANATIKLYDDPSCATPIATGTANGAGFFSIQVSLPSNSSTDIFARATDVAANESLCTSMPLTYEEDSTPPSMPTVGSVTPTGPVNNNNPVIAGTAGADEMVELYANAGCTMFIASTVADGAGNYSTSIAVSNNTTTNIYAKAVDLANNGSSCSSTFVTYVEDSLPPSLPNLTSSTPMTPANNNSPSINGSTDPNTNVAIYSDSSCTTLLASGTSNGSGTFSFPVSVTGDASTSIYAKAVDAANNFTACTSTPFVYVEDSTAPAQPVVSSTTPATRANQQAIVLSGTAEAGSTVKVYSDSGCTTLVTTGSTSGLGTFNINITSALNQNVTYYVKAADAAANNSICSSTFASFEAYSIASGAAYLTGTQTNAGTTPTNLNQSTAYSMVWSGSYFDQAYFAHTAGTHELQVLQAGNYLVSLSLPVTGALTNGALRTEVRVNGTINSAGRAQSIYISNTSAHSDSSNNLSFVLPGLASGDLIDVTVIQGGVAGTITVTGTARLSVEYLGPSRVIFAATATQTTNSTNLNQATAYPLQWTHSVADFGFTHSNSTSTEQIVLDAVGDYLVHVNVPVSAAVANLAVKAMVNLDGVTVTGGVANQGYIANASGHTQASIHWVGLVSTVSPNQVLTIPTQLAATAGTAVVSSGRVASIAIERLSSQNGVFKGTGTSVVLGTNLNQTTASAMLWSAAPVKDAAVFTHSTSTNSQNIQVTQAGDYNLLLNVQAAAALARANLILQVTVNGSAVSGAATKSFYIRNTGGHVASSGALAFPLHRLNANDTITVTSVREAVAGTITSPNASIVLIKKP